MTVLAYQDLDKVYRLFSSTVHKNKRSDICIFSAINYLIKTFFCCQQFRVITDVGLVELEPSNY